MNPSLFSPIFPIFPIFPPPFSFFPSPFSLSPSLKVALLTVRSNLKILLCALVVNLQRGLLQKGGPLDIVSKYGTWAG